MRKITAILAILCYVIPSLGLSVTAHYCGGKLAFVSLNIGQQDNCTCGAKRMNKSCCKDKGCLIKTSEPSQYTSHNNLNFNKRFKFKQDGQKIKVFAPNLCEVEQGGFVYPPPLALKEQLFLLYRVFRI